MQTSTHYLYKQSQLTRFLSPSLLLLAVIVFWVHNMLVTCAHPSTSCQTKVFHSTLLFTSSTIHCLCSSCIISIRLYFQLIFPRSIFMRRPAWISAIFSSILCKALLLPSHNTLMPQSLKPSWLDSIRSCPAAFSFLR